MTAITQLINSITPLIPFATQAHTQAFLNQYSVDDQAAIINALYIGRDHANYSQIQQGYVPINVPFDRFFWTGQAPNWLINPTDFAYIIYSKNTAPIKYFNAFISCVPASGYSLAAF